jgi:dCTP deaminase
VTKSTKTKTGILSRQSISQLLASGKVSASEAVVEGQLQPASLDLRLGRHAHRIRASFLPRLGERIADKVANLTLHTIDIGNGAVLETGCVYLVPLQERLELPRGLSAVTNPKSSTGRLDVFTRVVAEGVPAFDQIPDGYSGVLFAEICPQTFPILVRTGSRLCQIRFRRGPVEEAAVQDLSVDLSGETGGLVGYRAKRHTGVVDVDLPRAHRVGEYWEPLSIVSEKCLVLDPDQFYILASKEAVVVPADQAAEMIPFNPLVGEFRVHYAGFFDPGFGLATTGGTGARAVLEVRSHTVPFILEHGQTIGRLVFERMAEQPDQLYGKGLGSHYQAQGLKLSKHFHD